MYEYQIYREGWYNSADLVVFGIVDGDDRLAQMEKWIDYHAKQGYRVTSSHTNEDYQTVIMERKLQAPPSGKPEEELQDVIME